MKILQILPELHVGGVETGTVDLAKYLTRHGHEVIVVSNGGQLVSELEKEGIKHFKLPVHKKSLWTIIHSMRALIKIIEEEKVGLVHARSRVPAWIAFFACRKTRTPFLTTCHGYYKKHFSSSVMGWPKSIIVPSNVIGRHMIEDFNVSPQNIHHIPRSVDLEKFNVPRDYSRKSHYVISIVGRLTPLKGHTYFLQSMAKVIRLLPNVKILIIGDAPRKKEIYKEELQILTKRLGLLDYVEFLGNRRDIPELMAQTDCLVLSTITEEAFGRVIIEAQAAGVPVVATKVGGVVEVVEDGKTGLLVLPKDTDSMAKAVVKVLKDKKLAQRLAAEAKKKIENEFTLERMAIETIKVYEELLKAMRILVIKLSAVGDVILITASLKALREKYPHAKIHCLVGIESKEILQRCPYIDGLVVYDKHGKDKGLKNVLALAAKLRKFSFDKVVDFQNNYLSHLLCALSLPLDSYGYDRKWGFFLNHRLKDDKTPMPPVAHQFQVLKMMGIDPFQEARLELWPSKDDESYIQNLLDSEWLGNNQNIVGLNISASLKWETKNWPLKHMAKLCDMLSSKNIRVVITGQEKDKEVTRELFELVKSKPANFVGKTTVSQLSALIKKCRVYVTPDSAPMHIAAGVGTPFIAFFGPTDARRHLPPTASGYSIVVKENLPCMPCYSTHCRIGTHDCMEKIMPENIVREIEKLMSIKK